LVVYKIVIVCKKNNIPFNEENIPESYKYYKEKEMEVLQKEIVNIYELDYSNLDELIEKLYEFGV